MRLPSCLATTLLVLALAAPAFGARVDWSTGTFVVGGVPQVGYPSGNQAVVTTNNGEVSIDFTAFGTATGTHTGLGGTQPRVSQILNGTSLDPSLSLGTSADLNSTSLVNYLLLSMTFSSPVSVAGFTLYDVDRSGNSWQDFVAVVAPGAAVSYNTIAGVNETVTYLGLAGVRGVTGDISNDGGGADVGVSLSGSFTNLDLYFFQGPNVTNANQHGIGVSDIEYTPAGGPSAVPEPSSLVLAGTALLAAGVARLIRARQASTLR